MSDNNNNNVVIGFIAASVVFGLVVATYCVWKIYKAENTDPSLQYASRQERRRADDVGQAQAEAEAEAEAQGNNNKKNITPSEIELEIQAERNYLEEKKGGREGGSEGERRETTAAR